MDECRFYVRKLGLRISELYVGAIYAESMMTIVDTIRDPMKVNQMKYVEFLVFLCRIAHEHYEGTPYKREALYSKLDHLMDLFLSYVGIPSIFKLGELFEAEKVENTKRFKRKKRQLM